VGDRSEPAGKTLPVGPRSESPQPPPQPTPRPPPPNSRNRSTLPLREARPSILALMLAGVGWLVWIYGWVAEADTGYPDGMACTGHRISSEVYASCMRSSERGGAIAWALTLGLAVLSLVVLGRSRQPHEAEARPLTLEAGAMSMALAVAGVSVWILGARGGFYENRIGATTWHVVMVVATTSGLLAGWVFTTASRRRREGP
jgi:hypothetical protein